MSFRQQQVESTLQRAISQVITQRLSDPRITGLVSVTRVQLSPDRHNAYVFVSIMPEDHEKLTFHGLKSATGRIQSLLRKAVAMRTIPQIEFRLDPSIKKEAAVQSAIRQAVETEPASAQLPPFDPPEPPEADASSDADADANADHTPRKDIPT